MQPPPAPLQRWLQKPPRWEKVLPGWQPARQVQTRALGGLCGTGRSDTAGSRQPRGRFTGQWRVGIPVLVALDLGLIGHQQMARRMQLKASSLS